jgi:hypothetical protein
LFYLPNEICFHINPDREELVEACLLEFCICDSQEEIMKPRGSMHPLEVTPSLEQLPRSLKDSLHTKRSGNLWEELDTQAGKEAEPLPDPSTIVRTMNSSPIRGRRIFMKGELREINRLERNSCVIGEMSPENEMR